MPRTFNIIIIQLSVKVKSAFSLPSFSRANRDDGKSRLSLYNKITYLPKKASKNSKQLTKSARTLCVACAPSSQITPMLNRQGGGTGRYALGNGIFVPRETQSLQQFSQTVAIDGVVKNMIFARFNWRRTRRRQHWDRYACLSCCPPDTSGFCSDRQCDPAKAPRCRANIFSDIRRTVPNTSDHKA